MPACRWRHHIRHIEGEFGAGISSVFVLHRWMFAINGYMAVTWICFVILPFLVIKVLQPHCRSAAPRSQATTWHSRLTYRLIPSSFKIVGGDDLEIVHHRVTNDSLSNQVNYSERPGPTGLLK